MTTKRDEIIDTTCQLLEAQGYQATGLNQILQVSGAPKGSLYHYFPDGKEELVAAAIERSAREVADNLAGAMAEVDDPAAAVVGFVRRLAGYVAESGFRQGGPITAVALEAASTNERLRLACRDAYRLWQGIVADKLRPAYGERNAVQLAALVIAAIEGGIILSRSEQSQRPLWDVADMIEALLGK
ncbi:TetR/AcrR family transcriptional regulator [Promineifilum sp.]|uniref:TetR/AcrR family transcriptional regulator n=1 Tax=Promineifilum sp. TaxID=2664178 RepID=UPI0035AFC71B